MDYRNLGASDILVSRVGLGTLHFGVFCDLAHSARLVHAAVDQGINFFDTGPLYGSGNAEAFLGKAVAGRRHQAVISTKVGLAPAKGADGAFGVAVVPLRAEAIVSSVEHSLRALGTDYIDLLQLHAFDPSTPLEETIPAVSSLLRQGKIRAWGVSNYDVLETEQLRAALAALPDQPPVSFQVHFNLLERRAAHDLFGACERLKLGIICNRAIARGALSGKYKSLNEFPPGSRAESSARIRGTLSPQIIDATSRLELYAREQGGRSATELAIAWILSQAKVCTSLVGVRDQGQLSECLRGASWTLHEPELGHVDSILRDVGLLEAAYAKPEVYFER